MKVQNLTYVFVAENNGPVTTENSLEGESSFCLSIFQPHFVPLHHKYVTWSIKVKLILC